MKILLGDGTIKTDYNTQLKEWFEKSFDIKVQELIKNSKILRLKQERSQVESEKISIIGKLLGKGKLKQTRLENIDLKVQLLMSENKSYKPTYSLEDSLSDLYSYVRCELGENFTTEMREFLTVIKTDSQLKQLIDQKELVQQINEKSRRKTE